ncbi:acyl-CoA desaturase [Pseudoalteromonas luteoviolacea]|uniref:acyl-CoA desaturase n=1 Tax=Pseudoalteromonas luteoviolacea TaxID=43657 RepID=UPI001B3852A9|nr:acyl-CoA desaturase [Pseudoalteromonas luteoviolacea]MBQ4835137.1 acyl-CoA desaturase [Pseudoalteromonas luteoviolacea]
MRNSDRVISTHPDSAYKGTVVWSPIKSIWFLFNLCLALFVAPFYFSWSAMAAFLVLTAVTLCFGHSLGMHRLLIHRSYQCPKWMEYTFVYLGVLVGMAGPVGMLKQHDLRDWAQRQNRCHDFLLHGSKILKDGWWQLNCDLRLDHPPIFNIESRVVGNRFYQFMESSWLCQQLVLAIPLFWFGGLSWVLYGVSLRVVVSIGGHWLIGYFAHNHGERTWKVEGAAVQGHNIRLAGFLSMGEAWHNNHHAFPGSAMLGLYKDEPDPGWWVLNALSNMGVVTHIKLPEHLPERSELVAEFSSKDERQKRVPEKCKIANLINRSG